MAEMINETNVQQTIFEPSSTSENMEIQTLTSAIHSALTNKTYCPFITPTRNKGYIAVKAKNLLAVKISPRKKGIAIEVKKEHEQYFENVIFERNDSTGMSKYYVFTWDEVLTYAFSFGEVAVDVLANQGGESFGCCSRYEECSNAKRCIHPDKLTAIACGYRKNLEKGLIFYGANKND